MHFVFWNFFFGGWLQNKGFVLSLCFGPLLSTIPMMFVSTIEIVA